MFINSYDTALKLLEQPFHRCLSILSVIGFLISTDNDLLQLTINILFFQETYLFGKCVCLVLTHFCIVLSNFIEFLCLYDWDTRSVFAKHSHGINSFANTEIVLIEGVNISCLSCQYVHIRPLRYARHATPCMRLGKSVISP